jgi:hypothetical protein
MVSEIRSTNPEIVNKFEIQSTNDQNTKDSHSDDSFGTFEFCSFDIVSDFEIRISDLTPFIPNSYDLGQKCKIAT